jgi:integrase
MTVGKITKTTVDRLGPGEVLWDTEVKGFGIRRHVTEAKHYVLRYRFNGRQTFKKIGRHGSPFTPDSARKEAKRLLGEVVLGTRPSAQVGEATFGEAVEAYITAKTGSWKPGTAVQIKHHLRTLAKPLHPLTLGEIDRRRVADLLASIQTNSGPVARNRTRTSISAMFTWLDKEGRVAEGTNPAAGTAKADEGPSRDRVLTPNEIAEVWNSLPQDHLGDIVRLLILTGQRRDEIAKLRWSEIDFDRALLILPPARTKNKRTHELPLSRQASAILRRQSQATDAQVFERVGWAPRKITIDKTILAKRKARNPKAEPMPHWTIHDLRRTCATGLAELGVLPHVIECVLNHLSGFRGGVAAIYNRNRYLPEMREALERWANHVEQITTRVAN